MKYGFDNQKYLVMQSEHIKDRIAKFGDKLYLEFGGKLFDDYHASRVLPGFQPDSKLRMLLQLADQAEIVIAISAEDIEKNKIRGDLGITYDVDVLRLIQSFRDSGLYVGSVVITRFTNAAEQFKSKLEAMGIKVYRHYSIDGYPSNISRIVSEEGYGKNEYIETTRPLVIVTAPLPAVPREPPRHQGGIREIRDLPHLEPAAQASGEPRLRGRHRGSERRQHDRPLPPGSLRGHHRKL